jgi:deazaflavin-dependent oxidoreductase (nitroreductase family)
MTRKVAAVAALSGALAGFVAWWRRHPRFGTRTMNRLVNPWLVRQGVVDATHGEIALLEHVGRVSGTTRLTPVHPVDTPEGVRIVMPLGSASHWGRNVVAAGHCRMQRGQLVLELDTPRVVDPTSVDGMPRLTGRVMSWLGFRYLLLRRFAEHPGAVEPLMAGRGPVAETVPTDPVA